MQSVSDRRLFLAGVAGGLALLSGCGKAAKSGTQVVLGDQVHLLETKLSAAGQLKDLPYGISWGNFPGAAPLLEALNAGAVDTAPAGDLPIILAAAAGCRLKIAAVNKGSPKSMAIIVPRGSPMHSVEDLVGKTVIVSSARGSISHFLLLEALREKGLPPSSVKIGYMLPNDAAAAFATGQIAAWAIFGTYQARAEADGARILRDGTGIGPGYSAITVSERALADPHKRAAIADILSRARAANTWCIENPDAYARLYARQTGMDPAIARVVAAREKPGLSPPDAEFVTALQSASDRFYETYKVLPHRVDVASLVVPDLLRA
ncbi:ABC transporter substrate-binding protein [Novosphingobium sp. PhB165]|uniref:ABC transporter substrate-binding protein n=1 Tax=Novosphingobium sp. PhB165 TaxID=2485105 RepID=UPI001404D043|nr:ABC transporter substrate-binding protein [Novosphingobium sp. PhB165]